MSDTSAIPRFLCNGNSKCPSQKSPTFVGLTRNKEPLSRWRIVWIMDRPLACYLRRIELRNTLNNDERDALLAIEAPLVRKSARWDLVRLGDHVTFACLVAEGLVGRGEQFADGKRHTTAIYVPGDMCDLHSVAVPTAAWAITALTDCAVYEVPHGAILDVAQRYPHLAMAFWRDTIVDASVFSKWVSVLSRHPLRQRLAHLLCELGYRMAAAGEGERENFELQLTQDQLAEVLGATAVHVYRTFKSLRADDVLATDRRSIRVLDLPALLRIADFDPTYLQLQEK